MRIQYSFFLMLIFSLHAKTKLQKSGDALYSGGKELKKIPDTLDSAVESLKKLPAQLSVSAETIKSAIRQVQESLAQVASEQSNIESNKKAFQREGVTSIVQGISQGLDSLQKALINLASRSYSLQFKFKTAINMKPSYSILNTCPVKNGGVLCSYLENLGKSSLLVTNYIDSIQKSVNSFKHKLGEKYLCWATEKTLPNHMIDVGHFLRGK